MKRGRGTTRRIGALPPMFSNPAAKCRDHDPELFYPDRYDGAEAGAARAVCEPCSLRAMCLTWALSHEPNHGIWAGMSPAERALASNERS